jgi:hypothetical protein
VPPPEKATPKSSEPGRDFSRPPVSGNTTVLSRRLARGTRQYLAFRQPVHSSSSAMTTVIAAAISSSAARTDRARSVMG